MWINTEELKRLMNGEMTDYELRIMQQDIQRAEEREEERRQRKIAERNAFLTQVASLLQEYPGKPLCPTDLQFMYYRRFSQPVSCSKITRACLVMYLNTRWSDNDKDRDYPREVFHVRRERSKKRNDKHVYYTWIG